MSRAAAHAQGRELAALGFTMSFTPVADVTAGPSDPTIGVRAPGDRPRLVARVATAQTASLDRLTAHDLVPFAARWRPACLR